VKLSLCERGDSRTRFRAPVRVGGGGSAMTDSGRALHLRDDAWRMPPSPADIRRACADAGIAVSGLHWMWARAFHHDRRTARSGRRASMSCAADRACA